MLILQIALGIVLAIFILVLISNPLFWKALGVVILILLCLCCCVAIVAHKEEITHSAIFHCFANIVGLFTFAVMGWGIAISIKDWIKDKKQNKKGTK